MKRIAFLIICAAAFFAAACQEKEPAVDRICFTADDYVYVGENPLTKTSIAAGNAFIWSQNDTVGVYPDTGSQVFFEMTSGAGAGSATFDGGGWAFKPSAVYYSYYPFIGDIYLNRNHIPVSFVGQQQRAVDGIDHIGPYDYMYADTASAANGVVGFEYHHLCCIIKPYLTLPAGTWTKVAITAPSKVFAVEGYYDLMAQTPEIIPTKTSTQIQIDLKNITLTEETVVPVFIVSVPVNLKGQEITVSVRNSEGKEYQCKKTPSNIYNAGRIGGLTCNNWTEAPMSLIIEDWGDGGSISGTAD